MDEAKEIIGVMLRTDGKTAEIMHPNKHSFRRYKSCVDEAFDEVDEPRSFKSKVSDSSHQLQDS